MAGIEDIGGRWITDLNEQAKMKARLGRARQAGGLVAELAKKGIVARPITTREDYARMMYAGSGFAIGPGEKPEGFDEAVKQTDSYLEKMGKIFVHDFASTGSGLVTDVGGFAAWVGKETGLGEGLGNWLAERGLSMQDYLDEHLGVENPDLGLKITGGMGSLLSFLIPGFGVAKLAKGVSLLGKTGRAAKVIESLFGAATSSAMEAAIESSERERRLIKEGMSPAEAFAESRNVFFANLPVLVGTNITSYFNPFGRLNRIAQVAMAAGGEGVQEAYQTAVQHWANGMSVRDVFKELGENPTFRKEIIDSAIVGTVTGGIASTVLESMPSRGEPEDVEGMKLKDAPGINVDPKEAGTGTYEQFNAAMAIWQKNFAEGKDPTRWSSDWINAASSSLHMMDNETVYMLLREGQLVRSEQGDTNPDVFGFMSVLAEELTRRGEMAPFSSQMPAVSMQALTAQQPTAGVPGPYTNPYTIPTETHDLTAPVSPEQALVSTGIPTIPGARPVLDPIAAANLARQAGVVAPKSSERAGALLRAMKPAPGATIYVPPNEKPAQEPVQPKQEPEAAPATEYDDLLRRWRAGEKIDIGDLNRAAAKKYGALPKPGPERIESIERTKGVSDEELVASIASKVGEEMSTEGAREQLTEEHRAAEAFANLLGHRVVWLSKGSSIYGSSRVLKGSIEQGVIFASVKSKYPPSSVVAHEIWHAITDNDQAARELWKIAKSGAVKDNPFLLRWLGVYNQLYSGKPEFVFNESVAQSFAQMLGKREVWEGLARENPGVFRQIADAVLRAWQRIMRAVQILRDVAQDTTQDPESQIDANVRLAIQTEPFVKDVAALERQMLAALKRAAERAGVDLVIPETFEKAPESAPESATDEGVPEVAGEENVPEGAALAAYERAMANLYESTLEKGQGTTRITIKEARDVYEAIEGQKGLNEARLEPEKMLKAAGYTRRRARALVKALRRYAHALLGSKKTDIQMLGREIAHGADQLEGAIDTLPEAKTPPAPKILAAKDIPREGDVGVKRAVAAIRNHLNVQKNVAEEIARRMPKGAKRGLDAAPLQVLLARRHNILEIPGILDDPRTGEPFVADPFDLASNEQKLWGYFNAVAMARIAEAQEGVSQRITAGGAKAPANRVQHIVYGEAVKEAADFAIYEASIDQNVREKAAERYGHMTPGDMMRELGVDLETGESYQADPEIPFFADDMNVGPGIGGRRFFRLFPRKDNGTGPRQETRTESMDEWINRERQERDLASRTWQNRTHTIDRTGTRWLDDLFTWRRIQDRTVDGELSIEDDPVKLSQMFRGWAAMANMFVKYGVRSFKDLTKVLSKRSLADIVTDKKYKIHTHWQEANYYLIAKRILSIRDAAVKGRPAAVRALYDHKGNMREGAAEEIRHAENIVREYEKAFPEWATMSKEITDYSNALLKFALEANAITQEMHDNMVSMYEDFVPLEVLDLVDPNTGVSASRERARSPVRSLNILRGGMSYVPPLTSLVRKTYSTVRITHESHLKQKLYALLVKYPEEPSRQPQMGYIIDKPRLRPLFKRAEELTKAAGISRRKAAKQLRDEFGDVLDYEDVQLALDLVGLSAKDMDTIQKLMVVSDFQGKNVVSFFQDGELKQMRVNPAIYEALTKVSGRQTAEVLQHVAWMTKWLRAGATWNPEFAIRNPLRDIIAAAVQAKYLVNWQKGPISGLRDIAWLPVRMMRGFMDALGRTEVYKEWVASYGAMAEQVAADITGMEKKTADMLRAKGALGTGAFIIKHPLYALQALSSLTEAGTRLAVYKKSLSDLMETGRYTKREAMLMAGLESREGSIDFNKMGSYVAPLNQLVAFLNAYIQGHYKFYRALADKERRGHAALTAGLMVTLPSLILWYLNHDEEWYKERPRWEKNLFWIISVDGGKTRWYFPKPFEIGLIFGSLPERMIEQLTGEDRKAALDWLAQATVRGIPSNIMPPVTAAIEGEINYSFFRGERIVPAALESLPSELQYTARTSEFAKMVGRVTKTSPIMWDNWVRGSFAGLGVHARDVVDWVLLGAQGKLRGDLREKGDPARWGPEDVVLLKAFMRTETVTNTRYVDDFYDLYEDSVAASAALRRAMKAKLDPAELPWLVGEHLFYLVIHDPMSDIAEQVSKITSYIRVVEGKHIDMDPVEKRDTIRALYMARNRLLKTAVEQIEALRNSPVKWEEIAGEQAQRLRRWLK